MPIQFFADKTTNKNVREVFPAGTIPGSITVTVGQTPSTTGDKEKKQVRFCVNDTWWYSELMPDTVSAIVL